MILPLAHFGHFLPQLIYAAPVFIVVGALVVTWCKDRHGEDLEAEDESPETPPF